MVRTVSLPLKLRKLSFVLISFALTIDASDSDTALAGPFHFSDLLLVGEKANGSWRRLYRSCDDPTGIVYNPGGLSLVSESVDQEDVFDDVDAFKTKLSLCS